MNIISAEINERGELEVIRRFPSNAMLCCHPPRPAPDRIVKEIYRACDDGTIRLSETKEGVHYPARYVEETIEFK